MSSNDPAISVENLTKTFKVDGKAIRRGPSETEERSEVRRFFNNRFKALDDVSLTVAKGETVGIMGRNGAGKSTLLKVISGMMKPDSGTVTVAGPVYSVMGMGVGFDRNLSGRENIQIKGAVMGADPAGIADRLDWIVEFAELGDYIYQPLRTYSKGMLSRLAFAITFAFDPDILIVDEALSGGDGAFKRKAAARLNEINDSGATILLVSHGPAFHKKLCDRCILMDKGTILTSGTPSVITAYYDLLLETPQSKEERVLEAIRAGSTQENTVETSDATSAPPPGGMLESWFDPALEATNRTQSKTLGVRIDTMSLVQPKTKETLNCLKVGANMRVSAEVEFLKRLEEVEAELTIKTEDGVELFTRSIRRSKAGPSNFKKGAKHAFNFNLRNRLLAGMYYVDLVVRGDGGGGVMAQHRVSDALVFRSLGAADTTGLVDLSR